jgi:hypothetical protein
LLSTCSWTAAALDIALEPSIGEGVIVDYRFCSKLRELNESGKLPIDANRNTYRFAAVNSQVSFGLYLEWIRVLRARGSLELDFVYWSEQQEVIRINLAA